MGRAPRGGEGAALTNRQLGASNPVFSFAALAFSSLLSQFCSVLVNCTISSLRVTDREARLHLSARLTRVAAASRVRRYGPADRDGPCRRAECRDVGHIGGSRLVVVPCPAVPAGAWRSRSRSLLGSVSYSRWAGRAGCGTPSDHRCSDCDEIGTRRYRASKYAHGYPHTTQHEFRQGAPGRASAGSGLGPLRVAPAAVALGLELIFAMLLLVLLLVDGG